MSPIARNLWHSTRSGYRCSRPARIPRTLPCPWPRPPPCSISRPCPWWSSPCCNALRLPLHAVSVGAATSWVGRRGLPHRSRGEGFRPPLCPLLAAGGPAPSLHAVVLVAAPVRTPIPGSRWM